MAAIGREGGESRSAAARQARQRLTEREVALPVTRDGMDGRRFDARPVERSRVDTLRTDGRGEGPAPAL
jgi:hypothetical protein